MMDNLFMSWACHKEEIEDFIEVLSATDDPNDKANQYEAARCVGLNFNNLTSDEVNYIERRVEEIIND